MKKTLLSLMLFCASLMASAQGIQNVSFNPVYPTDTDYVDMIVSSWFPSGGCDMQMEQHSTTINTIDASMYYCLGPLTFICNSTDTIHLGQLAAGNYTASVTIFTDESLSGCLSFLPAATSNLTLTVDVSTSIERKEIILPVISQINKQISVKGVPDGSVFHLMDLSGRLIQSVQLSENVSFLIEAGSGIYLYSIQTPSGKLVKGKISIY